jgi:hypothetical protein
MERLDLLFISLEIKMHVLAYRKIPCVLKLGGSNYLKNILRHIFYLLL